MSPGERFSRVAPDDVRLRGFADRATVERAAEWVEVHARRLGSEEIAIGECVGRIPAAPLAAPADHPPVDRAGQDGYAVRSGETVGASGYGPVPLRLRGSADALPPGAAALVAAGSALPRGADAVVGFDAAQVAGDAVEIMAPVAEGAGVERAGQQLRAGAPMPPALLRPLRPHDAALLASAGVERVAVVARPRVRVVVAGPKAGGADGHGPMLRALVERDGGAPKVSVAAASFREAMLRALASPGPDLLVATGRTGTGPDDDAALALARAGELMLHGVALRPGGSCAMGYAMGTPVILLPGDPLACLCAYELFAGPFVRRLGGRDPALPHATVEAVVGRKIVSAVGSVDVCQVRVSGGAVEPLGVAEFGGLAAAGRADGFVIVPAALEGYASGARVTVHLY